MRFEVSKKILIMINQLHSLSRQPSSQHHYIGSHKLLASYYRTNIIILHSDSQAVLSVGLESHTPREAQMNENPGS